MMPRRKTGRLRGRPRKAWAFSLRQQPDPDRYDLLDMLLIAKGEPLQPYALAKKLDLMSPLSATEFRNIIRLGNKLTRILQQAKLIIYSRKTIDGRRLGTFILPLTPREILNEHYVDEELRQQALDIVKQHIVFSSIAPGDYSRWEAAELAAYHLKNEMREKQKGAEAQLEAFIKSRT